MNQWIKFGFWSAIILTTLWLLAPPHVVKREKDAVEIHYMGNSGPIKDALEDAVREFERLSEARHAIDPSYPVYRVISGQNASASQTEDPTRFLVSLAGGMPPDVIFFDRFAISEWAARNTFTPLDDFLAADQKSWDEWLHRLEQNSDELPPWPGATREHPQGVPELAPIEPVREKNYYASCWNEAVYRDPISGNSGVYGIPANADNRVLLYNKDILVRHGFVDDQGEAKPPQSWEELREMALAMTEIDEKGNVKSIGFIPNYGNSWLYMYGWQAGGKFMSPDGLRCTLNDPGITYALEFMTQIYEELGGAKQVYAFQSTFQGEALDPFIQGKVAMKIDGVWIMKSLAFYGRDLDVGAAPPPLPQKEIEKGREPLSWVGGWAYSIPSTAREKQGAWELIRFLVSDRAHEIMMASENFINLSQGRPFIPRQYPNRKQNDWAYNKFVLQNDSLEPRFKQVMAVFNGMLDASKFRPVTPVGQKLWNAQIWAMEDAIFQKKSPREALDYYAGIVQRDLDTVLHPTEGKLISNWRWFIWMYALLVVVVIILVYLWDTKPGLRAFFRIKRKDQEQSTSALEGKKGSYFRAQWKEGVICASPWIFGFIVFTGGPLVFSIVISFCRFDVVNPAVFTALRNYIFMFSGDELFWKSLYNTVFMVIGVPLGMAIGLGMALLLNLKIRGIAVWRTLFYLPSIVPIVASSILWIWIFNPQSGLLNGMLSMIGIEGPLWLQDENTSKWALILMGLWVAGGGMIIWLAGLKGISESYYEAASIDGASTWQKFVFITLPMLTPYIFFNLVMGLIGTFQIFTQAFIMTAGGPVNSTLFYAYHLFNNAFRYLQMGYAAAMAWFLFLIVVTLTAIQMKVSKKWVHYEGE